MQNATILLVEDNPDDEKLTLYALKKSRIRNHIEVVRDGAEALDYIFCRNAHSNRNPLELPQVILLDLKLPKVDGHEVLKQIRSHEPTKRIPVVLLTSSVEEQDVVRGYDSGANSYVCKPVDPDEFVKAIEQLELYWVVLNESIRKG